MEPKIRMGATQRNLQAQLKTKIFPICFLGSLGEFRLVALIRIFGSFPLLRQKT
jgi:hypothetical protein